MTGINRVGMVYLFLEQGGEYLPDTSLDYITQGDMCYVIHLKDGRQARTANPEFVVELVNMGIKFIENQRA